MYICEECKLVFDEPDVVYDNLGLSITERGGFPGEKVLVCTGCKSEEIEEADICMRCGEVFPSYEIDDGFCAKCQAKLMEQFSIAISEVKGLFTDAEFDFLCSKFDW